MVEAEAVSGGNSMFADLEDALRFAFRVKQTVIYKINNFLSELRGGGCTYKTDRLSPHELHAQAAMIFAAINRLPDYQQAVIYGYYDPNKRTAAAMILAKHVAKPTGITKFRLTRDLIAYWLGEKNSYRNLSNSYDLSYRNIRQTANMIFGSLNSINYQAKANLEQVYFKSVYLYRLNNEQFKNRKLYG